MTAGQQKENIAEQAVAKQNVAKQSIAKQTIDWDGKQRTE